VTRLVLAGLACCLAGLASTAAAAPEQRPKQLVVALSLPAPGFQVGAVRGRDVVYARGLEIELVRAVARRLGVRRVVFVQVADPRRLVRPGGKPWDLAVAQVRATKRTARAVDLSAPYLRADPVVLLARGVPRPGSLAGLRTLQLCVVRGSAGASSVSSTVRPRRRPLVVDGDRALLRLVQTGRCDAAVREAPQLGRALASRTRSAYGPLAGRIPSEEAFAIALRKGSPLTGEVDRALRRLRADGRLGALAQAWLGLDPARLRPLR
jgi:ABC-type amino acid transport substrate-binding protein